MGKQGEILHLVDNAKNHDNPPLKSGHFSLATVGHFNCQLTPVRSASLRSQPF